MSDIEQRAGDGAIEFILRPHRSLSPRGFWVVMAAIAGFSFAAGTLFWILGAWPVMGFLGLDIVLVYVAFRASYARAHEFERVRLTEDAVTIERVDHWGRATRANLKRAWLRVAIEDGRVPRLVLTSHGQRRVIGGFLAPDERAELAAALKAAINRQ